MNQFYFKNKASWNFQTINLAIKCLLIEHKKELIGFDYENWTQNWIFILKLYHRLFCLKNKILKKYWWEPGLLK